MYVYVLKYIFPLKIYIGAQSLFHPKPTSDLTWPSAIKMPTKTGKRSINAIKSHTITN